MQQVQTQWPFRPYWWVENLLVVVHSGHSFLGVWEDNLVYNGVDSVVVAGGSGRVIRQGMTQTCQDGNKNRPVQGVKHTTTSRHNVSRVTVHTSMSECLQHTTARCRKF